MNFLYILLALNVSNAECPEFKVTKSGRISAEDLDEVSGIVQGNQNLWVHNDSGDDAKLYGLATDGKLLSTLKLVGIKANDWEDIAVHRKPQDTTIYVGDIGDNAEKRSQLTIHFFTEPIDQQSKSIEAQSLTIDYGSIGPQDAESLAIDPQTGDLYVLTKGRSEKSYLLHKPAPHVDGEQYSMNTMHKFDVKKFMKKNPFYITAMDIDPTGSFLIYRNYFQGFLLKKQPNGTWKEAWWQRCTCTSC